jgi:hypothetical protein
VIAKDRKESMAFHSTDEDRELDAVALLRRRVIDIEARNWSGETALYLAEIKGI